MSKLRIESTSSPQNSIRTGSGEPNGSAERATVERVVHLGFEVRADLALEDGREVWVQMTKTEAERLALDQGAEVFVAARQGK